MRDFDPGSNGHGSRRDDPHPDHHGASAASPSTNGKFPPHRAEPFTANDTLCYGYRLRMQLAACLLGLGSTGSKAAQAVVNFVRREFGRIPTAFRYAFIDAASCPSGVEAEHFHALGVSGVGTLPSEGFERIMQFDAYDSLRKAVDAQVLQLFSLDPELEPLVAARNTTAFWIIAGSGGTSGGIVHAVISLVHQVARTRNIRDPRVNLVLIGPEISLRDRTHNVTTEQHAVVPDTFANTLAKVCGDFASDEQLVETMPDGYTLTMPARNRVRSLTIADHSNGLAEFTTCDALGEMIGHACFLRMFTDAGKELIERDEDNLRLDVKRIPRGLEIRP